MNAPHLSLLGLSLMLACGGPPSPHAAPTWSPPKLKAPSAPPPPGYGRVYIEAVGEGRAWISWLRPRARRGAFDIRVYRGVKARRMRIREGTWERQICEAPCFVDLPQGQHGFTLLRRPRRDTFILQVSDAPLVYRHDLGAGSSKNGTIISSLIMGIGAMGVFTSPAVLFSPGGEEDGPIYLGAAVGLIALGGALLHFTWPEERGGVGAAWRLEAPEMPDP